MHSITPTNNLIKAKQAQTFVKYLILFKKIMYF